MIDISQRRRCSNSLALLLLCAWLLCLCDIAYAADGAHQPLDVSPTTAPIKIGFVVDMSGVASAVGPEMLNGMKLFLEHVHYRIAGRKIELVVEDSQSDSEVAVEKLHKLAQNDKVDVIDGFNLANVALKVVRYADHYKIPIVVSSSATDDLTQRKSSPWLLRTCSSASQITQPLGDYAYKHLGYRRVVTIATDFPFGWESVGGFQRTFEEAGGKVVQKIWYPTTLEDMKAIFSEVRHDADAIFVTNTVKYFNMFAEEYSASGCKLPVLATGYSYNLSNIGDKAGGAIHAFPYSTALDTPENRAFIKQYEDKFGNKPGLFAEQAYTSGLWIKKAIEDVHGDVRNKDKFLAALKAVQLTDAPRGAIKLDRYANPIENIYIRKTERVNGALKESVIFTYPNVSQFWKYNSSQFLAQPVYSRDFPPCKYCQ